MQRLAGSIILLSGWRRAVVAFLAGAMAVLGQAPYDLTIACFVAFPVLVWLLDGATAPAVAGLAGRLKPAFSTGWWFGFGYFLAGLWWIGSALLVESDTYAWALPFAIVGIPVVLSFFFGFAAAVARLLWSDGVGRIFALAFAFGLAERLREIVLTGFPWNPVGLAAMPVPLLMQSVSVVGTTGMNVLAVLVFAMPALLATPSHRRIGAAIALLLIAAHIGFGVARLRPATDSSEASVAVRIVQPNIDLTEKWDGAVRDRVFKTTMDLTTQAPPGGKAKPQLIVWPETSVPYLFSERPDVLAAFGEALSDGQLLLAGSVRSEGSGDDIRYYNSVVAIDTKGEIVNAVDKVHLVPFGEYIPFAAVFRSLGVGQIVAGPMNFAAGATRHPIDLPGGLRALPYICYEIVFPDLMPRNPEGRDVIVNVTNDAWFGDTPGPYQHLRQAQIRAVETGLPVIRAANTGISAAIDRHGRIVDALAIGTRGVIDTTLAIKDAERTVHISHQLVGLVLLGLAAAIAATAALRRKYISN